MTHALEIKNLHFKFAPQAPYFFKDLTVSFEKGRIHFIRGFNGAGKSTLFRLLRGKLEKQEVVQGQIVVGGNVQMLETGKEQYSALNTINMVQQKFDVMLADQLSFEQNLRLANLPAQPGLAALPTHKPAHPDRFHLCVKTRNPFYLLKPCYY